MLVVVKKTPGEVRARTGFLHRTAPIRVNRFIDSAKSSSVRFPQNFDFFFFDSVGLWTASTSDGVVGLCPFRQRGIWTLDSVDFATAWTFSVEMSGSSCSASGATGPDHYSVFLLFHFPFEENHQIKITANPENVDLRLSIRPPPRLGGPLQL